MATKQRTRKTAASIDLFLKKPRKSDLPKRGATLTPIDYKAIQKNAKDRDLYQRKIDEIRFPIYKARLEAIGITKEKWEKIGAEERKNYDNYKKNIEARPKKLAFSVYPIELGMCRQVTIWECQEKVCVDQPVPIDVDEFWLEGDSNVSQQIGPTFSGNNAYYYARVDGSSYWDWWNYHRVTKESTGAICFRASAVLVETATVRQVGVNFVGPLQTSSGGMANGLYLDGQIETFLVDSYGDGRQTITFQVSIMRPGQGLIRQIPSSLEDSVYNDPPAAYQNYADPYLAGGDYRTLPPSRVWDLNQSYPAGTFFLIEVRVSHWIKARGQHSFASVWHDFEAQPYINLESCSWEWPT